MSHAKKKLIVVIGPTAIGKTALAIQLAQFFKTEILSADSRQFYKELNIGVARPSIEELQAVIHHFINFLPIEENYSAGKYEADALLLLQRIFQNHDYAVCCGGSMLYLDALLNGLDDLPGDAQVRKKLQDELKKSGLESLQAHLKITDPEYYEIVDLNNPHRVLRALEVCAVTGKKYSDLRRNHIAERPFEIIKIGLTAEREWIYRRINQRVDMMLEDGLEEEVRSVFPMRHLNALNTVGYKEFFDYFDGKLSRTESIEKIKQHTRNFAKRQLTWWRRDQSIQWIEVDKTENVFNSAIEMIHSH